MHPTFILLLTFFSFSQVTSKIIGQDYVDAEKSGNFNLKWKVFNPEKTSAYNIYFQNNKKQTLLGGLYVLELNMTETKVINKSPFTGRANGILKLVNGNGTLEITINNLKYTDSGIFIVENVFGRDKPIKGNTTLTVNSAPEKCGSEIPQNFTCSAGSEITGNVTLFGKPFPRLTWTISGKKINGTVDTRNADQHQYTYSFKTKVSSAMCGKRIKYEAVGHKNETVKGNSMILMSSYIVPASVEESSFKVGYIVLIVIVVIIIVILIGAFVVLYKKKNGKPPRQEDISETDSLRA